jgi:polysaccharide biosynthesis/export protein
MKHRMRFSNWLVLLFAGLGSLLLAGCQTTSAPPVSTDIREKASEKYNAIILREGDSVKVSFPGAPNLDDSVQIRRDGKITLKQVGEIVAVGKTPTELEKEILAKYGDQLVVKQVSVSLGSSSYPIFVIGAVSRPGKIMADRPLSVFEAIMEAGGVDFSRANLKKVLILREGDGEMTSFTLDLKTTFQGANTKPFYLKPSDVVFVREKFSWF